MITIKEISNKNDFENLKYVWNDLLASSDSNNFFLTWEWLYLWWKYYGDDNKLMILLAEDIDGPLGIAPLYKKLNGSSKTYIIEFLGSRHTGSDYLDFILEKGREREVLGAILDYMTSCKDRRRHIRLTDIAAESKNFKLLGDLSEQRFNLLIKKRSVCPYIPLTGSYEKYLKSLSSNMRYNIRRKRRRFKSRYEGEFKLVRDKSELEESIDELIRLNNIRFEQKNIEGPFSDERFSLFHRELINTIFDHDRVRLIFLRAGGRNIASLYNFRYADKYYYYQAGFDSHWEKESPGLMIISYCIEMAIEEGMKEFDFLQGDEEYKFHWTENMRYCLQVGIYEKSLFSQAAYIGAKCRMLGKAAIKRSLNR